MSYFANFRSVENEGDTLRLYFTDGQGSSRKLRIDRRADSPFVVLAAFSAAVPPLRNVTGEALAYLLGRNGERLAGSWEIHEGEGGRVYFVHAYAALAAGLTPFSFQYLCENLVREVADFDAKAAAAGLL